VHCGDVVAGVRLAKERQQLLLDHVAPVLDPLLRLHAQHVAQIDGHVQS
jgi:hypothetical protein